MKGVALVTGAASGIGAATAKAFLQQGVEKLVLADNRLDALEVFVEEIKQELGIIGDILALECDVTDEDAVKSIVKVAVRTFGRIDYAVNCAGITNKSLVEDFKTEDWDRVMNVNQKGVFFCMREQLAQMVKQDYLECRGDIRRAQRGSIVNICSINSFTGAKRNAAYVTSKHGILGLTRTCAIDYAAKGIRCNGVAPGYIETVLTLAPENIEVLRKSTQPEKTPAGRPGLPEEIADVVVFLSGEGSSYVNGSCWNVDGGFLTL